MPRKTQSVADKLRKAIAQAERRGMTRYQIAKASGVTQSALSQFVNSDRGLRLDVAEKIAKAIGHKLILDKCKNTT